MAGQEGWPLRPELAESVYVLYKATGDRRLLDAGRQVASCCAAAAACAFLAQNTAQNIALSVLTRH